jgi:signal transduction histidine kinase
MMERQVRQMVRLINDLLDISRIATNKFSLETEVVDVRAAVEAALEISRPWIEKGSLTLTVELPDEPAWVSGDRIRLAQVLSNLLNNAAKYTEPGGTVSLAVRKQASQVLIRVQDTGIGIPPEVLHRIFDLFTQVDRSLNRSQGGLGIGLALVKRLVEMHGGTVSVTSEGQGRGTEFTISLPMIVR